MALDGAEVVTLVDDTRREGRGFSATWRARMLEQAETIGRSGSAEIDMTTGKMIISKGMHSLLGIPFSPEPMRSERFLRWVPKEERGYVAAIWQGAASVDKARLAQMWMSWSPPGDCEKRAKALETQARPCASSPGSPNILTA